MPIYEFYCPACNTILSFFSRRINTEKKPDCPHCGRKKLERQVSMFASPSPRAKDGAEGAGEDLPFDESRMESAMETLAGEAEKIGDDNPRDAANLIRKFSRMSGMPLGGTMEEALSRMEGGEDPDAIEAELGEALESEDPFQVPGAAGAKKKSKGAPRRDAQLYEM
jgi:putative FmdB family regulatory protein